MAVIESDDRIWPRRASRVRFGDYARLAAVIAAVAILAASSVARFFIAGHQPLWLDETWTGAIAAQTGFVAFWRQVWLDVNAPLYYLVMHLWQAVFGLSDTSLRVPGAIFGLAAPVAIAVWGDEGLERPARLTWAVLLAVWIPGLWLSGDARCYTLLLLFCTLQILAFARMLRRPDLRSAALWCGISGLAILTHYHAAIPTAFEGLAYLALARERAVRTWPAALLFAPVVAWLAVHAPRIAAFTQPGVAWYPKLKVTRLGTLAEYLIGKQNLGWSLLAIGVVGAVLYFALRNHGRPQPRRRTLALWIAVGVAVLSTLLVVGLGFLRPTFTDRYLTPFAPALLLGVALIVQALSRRVPLTYLVVVLVAAGFAAPYVWRQAHFGWRYYNWETASQALMRGHPDTLVFVWDHPASRILAPEQLEAIGGFFFRRAHQPVVVRPVVLPAGVDPNPALLAQAQGLRTAIIWTYDRGVEGTAARWFRPDLSALDPSLTCHNYGWGSVGVLACDRVGSVKTSRK